MAALKKAIACMLDLGTSLVGGGLRPLSSATIVDEHDSKLDVSVC